MKVEVNCLRIGMLAPDFVANSTMGPIKMARYQGMWVVFFSHPGDFTPVCTTEFLGFAALYQKFRALNTYLLGLSIDSNSSHLGWANSIYEMTGVHIPFPIVADRTGEVARMYGMLSPDASTEATVRSTFIIDPTQRIRAILAYPMTTGRNIPEILRTVEALQFTDETGLLTPANWQPGDPGILPPPQDYQAMQQRMMSPPEAVVCKSWYLCYQEEA